MVRNGNAISPWADFRALCRYYAACVTAAEHPTEYLPLKEERDRFVVLHPPVGWLEDKSFRVTLDKRRDLLFLSRMASRAQFDETLYVAIRARSSRAKARGSRSRYPSSPSPWRRGKRTAAGPSSRTTRRRRSTSSG